MLHLVNKNQFLDSPEWFGVTTDEYFQVKEFFIFLLTRGMGDEIHPLMPKY